MSTAPTELPERAAELRSEALRLLDGSGLLEVVRSRIGPVEIVGSVDLDLMVWTDIDLCTRLGPDEGRRLLELLPVLHERLARWGHAMVRVSFNDEYRRPGNPYGRGLYCGLKILTADGDRLWKVDLWAWDEATFEAKLAEHRRLASALSRADRDLVLRIKDEVHRRREYRDTITSLDVYAFAIEGGGRTVREFDEYLSRRTDSDARGG